MVSCVDVGATFRGEGLQLREEVGDIEKKKYIILNGRFVYWFQNTELRFNFTINTKNSMSLLS